MGNSLQKLSENKENLQQETQEEDANGSFTCEICIEPMSSNKKFKNKNLCVHPFCLDCIAKYIDVKIEDHTASIQCPGLNCKQVLDPLSCRAMISQSVFSRWCDLLCDNYVLGFERIYCPNRNCMEVVVNECGGNVKKSKCPNCKRFFCFQCKLAWHAGYGCEESRSLRDRIDILFGQLVESRAWIKCPGCGYFVERVEGCNFIRCRCRTQFCYKCGKGKFICECGRRSIRQLRLDFLIYYVIGVSLLIALHVFLCKSTILAE